jgi:NAD(P)-dependent dehydrogenase (short-subunit alcohol dehydrogenase family)
MQAIDSELEGKVALVTGSVTGIGEAIARRLWQSGATVMLHGQAHEQEKAEKLLEDLNSSSAGRIACHLCDIGYAEACEELVDAVALRFGGIDILVNNAAISGRSNLETTDAALFDRLMAVNVRAPLLLAKRALPHFRAAGGGTILNIGSINGYCGEQNLLVYSITKGALMTLSRNLADAHGAERIRVNHLNLGWTLTANEYALKLRDGLPEDWPARLPVTTAPAGRLLAPEEIAHFAMAFISPRGAGINGSVADLEQYPVIGRNPPKATD